MAGIKTRLSRVLDGLGVFNNLMELRKRIPSPWLLTLCYHRTSERGGAATDDNVVDATPAQFENQLAQLAESSTFVGVGDVIDFVAGRRSLPKNPVLITFDDGYKDCYSISLPILKRYGAKATFFIPTDFVEDRTMFWWDRISWTLRRSRRDVLALTYPRPMQFPLGDEGKFERAHQALVEVIKKTRGLDVPRFLKHLEETAEVALGREDEKAIVNQLLMTWDEIRALVAAGMDIGSHTRSHRVLHTIDPSEHHAELGQSREILRSNAGVNVPAIAYPVGYSIGDRPDLIDAVERAGYEVGFSCRSGVFSTPPSFLGGRVSRQSSYDIPRVLMDISLDPQRLAALTTMPFLAPTSKVDMGVGR